MHVAVEAVGIKQGGGVVVLNQVLQALNRDPRISRITVFSSPEVHYDSPRFDGDRMFWRERALEDRFYAARIAWLERGFSHVVDRLGADVALCMNGLGMTECPRVSYLQQSLYFSEAGLSLMPAAARTKYRALATLSRRSCTGATVVVQTDHMRKQVSKAWNVDAIVAPPAPPKPVLAPARATTEDDSRFVLWVGHSLGYKRKESVVERERDLASMGVPVLYAETGANSVARSEIRTLMQRAVALISTSVTESFPLPLVEAMSWGCPIVSTDQPYARELCDDAALYFNDDQFVQWVRELRDDNVLADSLRARGRKRTQRLLDLEGETKLVDAIVEAG